jgi:hypothetical protein
MSLKDFFTANNGQLDKMYAQKNTTEVVDENTGISEQRVFFTLCCPNGQKGPNGENLSVNVGLSKNLTKELQGTDALKDKISFFNWCKANQHELQVTHAEGTKIPSMFLPGEGGYVSDFWD